MPKPSRARRFRLLAALALAALAAACGYLPRAAKVPMDTRLERGACAAGQAQTLLVMLPGVYSSIDEFVREGFVQAVRERRVAADVVLADAHRAYYEDRSVVDRLRADVIEPARRRGYREVWLVGISLGGAGALLYASLHPSDVAGVVALAPYTGDPPVTPPVVAAVRPRLVLGFGESDRFAPELRVLAATLPPQRVFTTPGGHDWTTWLRLWNRALDALPLRRCPA